MEKLSQTNLVKNDSLKKALEEKYSKFGPNVISQCKKLGLSDEDILNNADKINDWVSDRVYCHNCPGLKNCKKANPHVISDLKYENGFLSRVLSPCKLILEKIKFEKLFIVRDFPQEWLEESIQTADHEFIERKKIFAEFLDSITSNKDKWFFITGTQNTGKSYVAAMMANEIARRDLGEVCYINTASRFRQLMDYSTKKNDLFYTVLNYYSTCKLLVLDDFGNEYKNDFVRDSILYEILSKRSKNNLTTIFTSDFKIKEIEVMYGKDNASMIRARQITRILNLKCGKEFSLGEVPAYQ